MTGLFDELRCLFIRHLIYSLAKYSFWLIHYCLQDPYSPCVGYCGAIALVLPLSKPHVIWWSVGNFHFCRLRVLQRSPGKQCCRQPCALDFKRSQRFSGTTATNEFGNNHVTIAGSTAFTMNWLPTCLDAGSNSI